MKKFILLFSILICSKAYAGGACIAPQPDNLYDARSPELKGRILNIDLTSTSALIALENLKPKVLVELEKLKIFTQFGGNVLFKELKTGDEVQIWVRGCSYDIESQFVKSDEILVVRNAI